MAIHWLFNFLSSFTKVIVGNAFSINRVVSPWYKDTTILLWFNKHKFFLSSESAKASILELIPKVTVFFWLEASQTWLLLSFTPKSYITALSESVWLQYLKLTFNIIRACTKLLIILNFSALICMCTRHQ